MTTLTVRCHFKGCCPLRIFVYEKEVSEIPHTRPMASVRNDRRRSTLRCDVIVPLRILPNSALCIRSLTCVRDDKHVIPTTARRKNPPQRDIALASLCHVERMRNISLPKRVARDSAKLIFCGTRQNENLFFFLLSFAQRFLVDLTASLEMTNVRPSQPPLSF